MFIKTKVSDSFSEDETHKVTDDQNGELSLLRSDTHLSGNLQTSGTIYIDGKISGDLVVAKLVLGPSGHIKGNIYGDLVELSGVVEGNITAHYLNLEKTAKIVGDICVCHSGLYIEQGGHLEGRSRGLSSEEIDQIKNTHTEKLNSASVNDSVKPKLNVVVETSAFQQNPVICDDSVKEKLDVNEDDEELLSGRANSS